MKRSMCGGFLLASLAGLWACSGDPTGDLVGSGITVQSIPTSLFMAQGEQKGVIVNVLDVQGNEQDITGFSFTPSSGAITVTEDTTYLATSAGQLGTSRRLFVDGVTPSASSITLNANGQSLSIPVVVVPVSAPVTLSANAVPVNQPITITFPADYKFGAGAGATIGGTAGLVLSYSADSTSVTVLPPPGASGALVLDSVAPIFAPTLRFSLPTGDSVTVDSLLAPVAGTGSPSTAPPLPIPAAGASSGFFDMGVFTAADITVDGGLGAQYYRMDVAEAGTYTITVNWSNDADIDMVLCSDATCSDGGDFLGSGIDQPETDSRDLVAGTYYLAVVLFDGTAPGTISILLQH